MAELPDLSGRIAIVGLAGRFPGARSPGELWRILEDGREATTWLDDEALLKAGATREELALPNYVKAAMVLPGMENFDASFFGFSPREAQILDPQHRHFMETCWEALEDAGHVPSRFPGAIGVFGGCGMQAYMAENLMPNARLRENVGMFLLRHTGNDKDFLTTRVSYLLNLTGPSIGIQTACSTSLVAVHVACQSLMSGECDMALAGGVSIEVPHGLGYIAAEGEILSPNGRCAAFDDDAKGTVFGSGSAVVVLRRLEDALRDGDNIRAVILGTAVNNDGATKAGYLAPSVEGQSRAAAEAVAVSGVEPATIDYIEAHGTGTLIGDPIELEALSQAYADSARASPLLVGSIKTNIGHLDTAAGVASLIKVVMALEHGKIPPTLNFRKANSRFAFEPNGFRVASVSRDWRRSSRPRRAGVNSLGVGGTNAHALIEEAPEPPRPPRSMTVDERPALFTLSAKTPAALDRLVEKWRAYLAQPNLHLDLRDAAFTTQVGREAFEHRLAIAARTSAELSELLTGRTPRRLARSLASSGAPSIVFMFPGGGAQYAGAGRDLYRTESNFREAADACLALVPQEAGELRDLLFGPGSRNPVSSERLEHPLLSILAVFTVSYALARMWESHGITPSAVIGHSAGDYAAAVVAGVMSLEDAVGLVAERGHIFAELPPGAMLSISESEAAVRDRVGDTLDIAVVNASDLTVASGEIDAIERLAAELDEAGIDNTRVRIGVAAHSRMLDPFLDRFRAKLARLRLSPARIPFVSGLTGTWAAPHDVASPEYWVRHLRETVRFGDGLAQVLMEPGRVLVEMGPGRGLSALARLANAANAPRAIVPTTRSAIENDDDLSTTATAAGHLWAAGIPVDLGPWLGEGPHRRVSLPTYAFEPQRHWIDPPRRATTPDIAAPAAQAPPPLPAITRIPDPDDWRLSPVFREVPLAGREPSTPEARTALLLTDGSPLASRIEDELRRRAVTAVRVVAAAELSLTEGSAFAVDPNDPAHWQSLIDALEARGQRPHLIVHLWSLAASDPRERQRPVDDGHRFGGLFAFMKAMALAGWDHPMRMTVVTSGAAAIANDERLRPANAMLSAPVRVWPHETPGQSAALVDVPGVEIGHVETAALIVDEVLATTPDSVVALRGPRRFVEVLEPSRLDQAATSRIRPGRTYLVTGAAGGLGRRLARHLIEELGARVALVGRQSLDALDAETRSIISAWGDRSLWIRADVTDTAAIEAALAETRRKFGTIDGVFHTAGAMDDAPLATKSVTDIRRVMAAKVEGAQILDALLPEGSIDLFAVFSSTSALLGPPGQIDYAAANAYVEALAASRSDGLSIDWGVWRDTGLALRAASVEAETLRAGTGTVLANPLLGRVLERSLDGIVCEAVLDPSRLWVLSGHVVDDVPVIPGTAYIDMMLGALAELRSLTSWQLDDVRLLSPLAVPFGTLRRVRTSIEIDASGAASARIESSAPDGTDEIEHANASARTIVGLFDDILAAPPAEARELPAATLIAQGSAVEFGARWNVFRKLSMTDGSTWAELALAQPFASETEIHRAHPALLDMAATIGLHALPTADLATSLFVPARVTSVVALKALPHVIHARADLVAYEADHVARFDVQLADAQGRVVARIEGLELRAVRRGTFIARTAERQHVQAIVESIIAAGIRSRDEAKVFAMALTAPGRRTVISSIALQSLQQLYRSLATPRERQPGATPRHDASSEPNSAIVAVEATATERAISEMFGDLLGLEKVSLDDEFLALGGHSLAAVRLFARIRRQLGADLPISTLFEAPSVRALAAFVDEATGTVQESPPRPAPGPTQSNVQPASAPSEKSVRRRKAGEWNPLVRIREGQPGRPPLIWIHGARGNVVSIQALADALPAHHPIYGLQAQGVDGRLPPQEKIEDMALQYVAAIRELWPEGPYCLLGYSGGGVIGYEMARQLEAIGQKVDLLAMIDTLSPTHASGASLRDWVKFARDEGLASVAAQAQNAMKVRLEMLSWKRHRNDPVEHETDALIVASQLTFEAYLRAQGRYHMLPYGGNVTLFRAVRSGIAFRSAGPTLGWAPHVTGRLDAVPLDADHETIIESPAIDVIVRNLSDRLDAVAMERLGLPPPVGDRTGWDRFSPGRPGTWSPLVCLSKGDDGRTPLVCVHGAGGNVFWAQRLIEHLPPGTPVYGLQAYGIDGRQRPLRTIEEMAERYVGFLLHQLPGRRFALLGYSGGGTIAYEMTRQLRSKGKDAPLLAMIDTLCPTHEIWPRLSDWLRYGRRRGIRQMLDKARYGLIEVVGPVVHPFMKLRRSYRPPEPALALETELFRSFVAAQRRYRLEPLDTRIVLFRASDDGVQYSAAGPTLGWGGLVGDMVESFPLDANHTNIIDGTPMNVIAGEMARRLSAIEADIHLAEASAVSADITDEQRPITVDRKAESDASQFLR